MKIGTEWIFYHVIFCSKKWFIIGSEMILFKGYKNRDGTYNISITYINDEGSNEKITVIEREGHTVY